MVETGFAVNPGNGKAPGVEPEIDNGFGHIAMLCDDVYASSAALEAAGVAFKKRPDEGRMKGLAFAKDPDGYWIEIIKRHEAAGFTAAAAAGTGGTYNLAQCMIRIKDPKLSVPFYEKLGMRLIKEKHFPPDKGYFSLFFMVWLWWWWCCCCWCCSCCWCCCCSCCCSC